MASYTDPEDVGRPDNLRLCPAFRDYTEAVTCPFDATPTIDIHALERPRDRRLGRLLDKRYEIVSAQERAGFGDLYLATDTAEQRDVSLKIFAADLCRSEDQAARFVLAAQRGAALRHRGTVAVLAVGHCVDGAYLVLEPLTGETLARRLSRCGRLDVGQHPPAATTPKADRTLETAAVPVRAHSKPAIVDVEIVESVEVSGDERPVPSAPVEESSDGGWVGAMVVQPATATAPPRSASPIPNMPGAYVPDKTTTLHVPRRDPAVPPQRRGRPEPMPEEPESGFGRTMRMLVLVAVAAGAVVGTTVYTTLTPYLPDPHPGAMVVTSTPSNATLVHVHTGRFIGMTPVTMFGWPNTPAELRLLKSGHSPTEVELQFPKRGESVDSPMKLWPVPQVLVASEPLGAAVRHVETGETIGRTPIRWKVPDDLGETVTLEFGLPGYDPHTLELRPIDVRAQQPVWVDFDAVQPPIE